MQIDEAVSKGQLRNLVDAIVSIDQYKSKIDEDRNMVVLAFEVMNEMAAGDLSNFIETGAYDSLRVTNNITRSLRASQSRRVMG